VKENAGKGLGAIRFKKGREQRTRAKGGAGTSYIHLMIPDGKAKREKNASSRGDAKILEETRKAGGGGV